MIEREPKPVVALPVADEETVELEGTESWLSTLDDPTDMTSAGLHPTKTARWVDAVHVSQGNYSSARQSNGADTAPEPFDTMGSGIQ